jgi:hypothetical protein
MRNTHVIVNVCCHVYAYSESWGVAVDVIIQALFLWVFFINFKFLTSFKRSTENASIGHATLYTKYSIMFLCILCN